MFFKGSKLSFIFIFIFSSASRAQDTDLEALASWVALDAPTGYEHLAAEPLQALFDGWNIDRHGNMIKTLGSLGPHKVIACGMDAPAFAVSQITEDGYLRLHHIGRAPGHPLWAQSHAGQQLRILTRKGPLVGVSAFENNHFSNLHRDETKVITADDLWVDVGASTAQEVSEMGINLLDPVIRHIPAWTYSDEIAGPNSGARIGCAAVLSAAEAGIQGVGTTTWILSSQKTFGWVGLSSALVQLGKVDELIILDKGSEKRRNEKVSGINRRVDDILEYTGVSKITLLAPRVSEPGALMEHVNLEEANNLLSTIVSMVDVTAENPNWVRAPRPPEVLNNERDRLAYGQEGSTLIEIVNILDPLVETSAVYGHEGPIRKQVRALLPAWAREIAQTDDYGNIWVDVGPKNEKATVLLAHMDEVGFEIVSIEKNGKVHFKRLGGMVLAAWEGQPALLQLDVGIGAKSAEEIESLKGIYLSRINPTQKKPDAVTRGSSTSTSVIGWFGLDADELHSAGVRVGMAATGYKEGHRLGLNRYTGRGLDDRVGTAALIMAIQGIKKDELDHRVIFAWTVREEGGHIGATALAKRYGMNSLRAYSIDTFVSSDTPLESPHFAYAPLGDGPVLRSIENSSMARPDELDRNRNIAKSANIKFQVGLTQGGTDGYEFSFWGAPNAGLSWPGRYSHGPAELADLRDAAGLVKLIQGIALAKP